MLCAKKCIIERYLPVVPSELCLSYKVIPLFEEREETVVAFANPVDIETKKQLGFVLGTRIRAAIAEEDKITALLSKSLSLSFEYSELLRDREIQ